MTDSFTQASEPWDSAAKHHKQPVPESASFGFILIAICVLMVVCLRFVNSRSSRP
jgi:hypothetical protein